MSCLLRRLAGIVWMLALVPHPALAQYAETARTLPVADGLVYTGTQIGSRLFIGGTFTHVAPPTGGAAVFDDADQPVPGNWPVIGGTISRIIPDTLGGWVAVGSFTTVNGQPHAGLVHVTGAGEVDPRFRIVADGGISSVALAHGRLYLAGPFTTVNGAPRRGLAALDASSGALLAWGQAFQAFDISFVAALVTSSTGVYVSLTGAPGGGTWGLAASDGHVLFHLPIIYGALAPTSTRLYAAGYVPAVQQNRVVVLDPQTGAVDPSWVSPVRFQTISTTSGDRTFFSRMILDGDTLYVAGAFRTAGASRQHLMALSASSGALLPWQPDAAFNPSNGVRDIVLLPSQVIAVHESIGFPGPLHDVTTFDRVSAAATPRLLPVFGNVATVAPVAAGVVVGGSFGGFGGEARAQLAAIDLDTGLLDAWAQPAGSPASVIVLATDGAALFACRVRDVGGLPQPTIDKLDADDGHVVASLDLGGPLATALLQMRAAGGRLYVWGLFDSLGGQSRTGLAAIDIATWTVLPWAPATDNRVFDLDVVGNTVYLAGHFSTIDATPRPGLAAIDATTGALLPWNPDADTARFSGVRVRAGRVLVSGDFRRISAVRRRGFAALDPVTADADAWNPDSPPGFPQGINGFALDAAGILYAMGGFSTIVGGQPSVGLFALSSETGLRLPWQPPGPLSLSRASALPSCLLLVSVSRVETPILNSYACLPPLPPPTNVSASLSGATATLSWTPPAADVTGYRIEVGRGAGQRDLATVAVDAGTTSASGSLPAGSYVARIRAVHGEVASMPSPDVSFAVAPPDVPGIPLDLSVATEGQRVRFSWRPPTVGTPAGYLLEVGVAPGRADFASLTLPPTSTFEVPTAPTGIYWARLRAINAAGASGPSNEVVINVDGSAAPCSLPPLAPAGLAASVTARVVTLTWIPATTGAVSNAQRIVVGSASGLDNLGVFEVAGPATTFSAPAPPGTHFVRVYGFNACGASPFSNEVQVVVP
ncbi:MAG: PQQ-binding-like beta-propeller repeat protein [Vicinamibacterales bacterium]